MRLATIGGLLTSTAIIGGGAFLGLSSVGGTYAMWTDSANITGPVVNSGSTSVRIGDGTTWSTPSTPLSIDTSQVGNMLPGDTAQALFDVETNNNGSHLSTDIYIETADPIPAPFEIHVALDSCGGPFLATGVSDTVPLSLGNWGSGSINTRKICVELSVPVGASAAYKDGLASTGEIEFVVTARQKQS